MGKAKYWGSELVVKPKKKLKPRQGAGLNLGVATGYLHELRQAGRRWTTNTPSPNPIPQRYDARTGQAYYDPGLPLFVDQPQPQPVAYTWENVYRNNFRTNTNSPVGYYNFLNLIIKSFITEPNSPITVDDIVFRLGDKLTVIRIHYNKTIITLHAELEAIIIERKRFLREIYGDAVIGEELMEREEEEARMLDDDDDEEDDPDTNF